MQDAARCRLILLHLDADAPAGAAFAAASRCRFALCAVWRTTLAVELQWRLPRAQESCARTLEHATPGLDGAVPAAAQLLLTTCCSRPRAASSLCCRTCSRCKLLRLRDSARASTGSRWPTEQVHAGTLWPCTADGGGLSSVSAEPAALHSRLSIFSSAPCTDVRVKQPS